MTTTTNLQLRPYQLECLEQVKSFHDAGGKRGLIALPTGSGKTTIFARFPGLLGQRMLVLAHREELLDQAKNQVEAANPGLWVEIEQADRMASSMADVVIASVQTIGRKDSPRLAKFDPQAFDILVSDEAHHSPAVSYTNIYEHFNLWHPVEATLKRAQLEGATLDYEDGRPVAIPSNPKINRLLRAYEKEILETFNGGMIPKEYTPRERLGAPLHIGVTATPNRGDNIGLEFVFDEIIYSRSIREMIEEGWLVPIRAYRWKTGIDISSVHSLGGDFREDELAKEVNTPSRNAQCLEAYREYCQDRKALIFCVDVQHTYDMLATFQASGIKTTLVIGSTPTHERRRIIEDYHQGKYQVLVNCQVATEGFDDPSTSAIIMARPTQSGCLYTQMMGRGTRTSPGKPDLVVVDMVDVSRRVKLATCPSLFGLPPYFDCHGKDVMDQEALFKEAIQEHLGLDLSGVETEADIQDKLEQFDIFRGDFMDDAVREYSALAWVPVPNGYILSLPAKQSVRLNQNTLGEWVPIWSLDIPMHHVVWPKFPQLASAFKYCDNIIREQCPESIGMLLRGTRWRHDPVTEAQLSFLIKLKKRGKVPPEVTDLRRLTKGQAASLITLALQT